MHAPTFDLQLCVSSVVHGYKISNVVGQNSHCYQYSAQKQKCMGRPGSIYHVHE